MSSNSLIALAAFTYLSLIGCSSPAKTGPLGGGAASTTSSTNKLAVAPPPAPNNYPMFPPTPAPAYGIYNVNPSLSDDGSKLVWFRRDGYNTEVVLTSTSTKRSTTIPVTNIHPHVNAVTRISGDGRHVFWLVESQLWQAKVESETLTAPSTVSEVTDIALDFTVNHNATRLAYLVAGPTINGRSPGYYGLKTASFDGTSWHIEEFLSPPTPARHASNLAMSPSGNHLCWSDDDTLMFASLRSGGTYQVEQVRANQSMKHTASGLSLNGDLLLSTGYPRGATGSRVARSYMATRTSSGWTEPRPLLPEQPVTIADAWLTPDGSKVVEHFLEYQGQGQLKAVGLRVLQKETGTERFSISHEIARYSGSVQIANVSLVASGAFSWSLYRHEIQPLESEILFRQNLDPSTPNVVLSKR